VTGNYEDVALSAAESVEIAPPSFDFDSVYEEHFSFVWRMARRLGVADESLDDVCQEVFFVVHKRLEQFAGRSSLKTWVFGILHNVVLVHRRSLGRRSPSHRSTTPPVDPETLADANASPYDHLSTAEAGHIARRLLETLDEEKRTILVLVEIEEMSVADVAKALCVNVNTAHARLRAARKQFTQAINRHRAHEHWRMP
jgi:RNA polymerase sigma-70 factor (ECF subfamily)